MQRGPSLKDVTMDYDSWSGVDDMDVPMQTDAVDQAVPDETTIDAVRSTSRSVHQVVDARPPARRLSFEHWPVDLAFKLFANCGFDELGLLTLTSKHLRRMVANYLDTVEGRQRCCGCMLVGGDCDAVALTRSDRILRHAADAGNLIKRLTCLLSTRDRLRVFEQMISPVLGVHTDYTCCQRCRCVVLKAYGVALARLTRGWETHECDRAYKNVCFHSKYNKALEEVLHKSPGNIHRLEWQLRCFYLCAFIYPYERSMEDLAFWLSSIVKPWPMYFQAKLLLMLFAPSYCTAEHRMVNWNMFVNNVPHDSTESKECFARMGYILLLLDQSGHMKPGALAWTEDDLISVFDEMIAIPAAWLTENVAHLLMYAGEHLTTLILHNKTINGRVKEVASILHAMFLAHAKCLLSPNAVWSCFRYVYDWTPTPQLKTLLIAEFSRCVQSRLEDVAAMIDEEEDNDVRTTAVAYSEMVQSMLTALLQPTSEAKAGGAAARPSSSGCGDDALATVPSFNSAS